MDGDDGLSTARTLANEVKLLRMQGRVHEAAAKLECTIQVLLDTAKSWTSEESRKRLLPTINKYMTVLENLKELASIASRRIDVKEGSTGHSYEVVFGPVMKQATVVYLDEPYLCKPYQLHNLVRFSELCAKNGITTIYVNTTNPRSDSTQLRDDAIHSLKASFRENSMTLHVSIRDGLHDRQAKFNNGFIVRIGRGLHFHHKSPHYHLGSWNDYFRPCLSTQITYDFDASLNKPQ